MTWGWIVITVVYGAGLGLFGHLLLSRKTHASLLVWTFWLLLIPPLGIPLYLTLGTDKIHHKRYQRLKGDGPPIPDISPMEDVPDLLADLNRIPSNRLATMTSPELLWNGDSYYDRLISDIDQAEDRILMQTYVWREDDEGQKVLDALSKAADRGVDIRILTDEFGSLKTAQKFFTPLIESGGHFSWTSTVQTKRSRFLFNLRNHRKVNLIDADIAYVGGMNIGKEYAGRQIGPWQDLQMRFAGSAIHPLLASFGEDWQFATGEQLSRPSLPEQPAGQDIPVCIVRSGPNDRDLSFLQSFQFICQHARERLDLFTPYFIPNEHVMVTIQTTALRGVKVRLMIPTLNEHQYMVDIGRANYEPLMEAGVDIYELPGMVHHAKLFRADNDIVFAGSHNLDTRSQKLNFELSLCFKDEETARRIDKQTDDLFSKSNRIDPAEFAARPLTTKLKQGFTRLFSPVL